MKKFGKRPPPKVSYSQDYLDSRNIQVPQVSALVGQSVSQYRKEILTNDIANGVYREGTGPNFNTNSEGFTKNANVIGSIKKNAQVVSNSGTGGTLMQAPEMYSPNWLTSNLNLPRDLVTINSWCRAFFALNPIVHNAISLHSTYPISKLQIKCPDPKIQQFFNEMIEELDLMNICVQIAQEFWLLGEAFVYADLDVNKGKWSRLVLQNPDYIAVMRNVVANDPIIMLKPDLNLKKIVSSNKPADIEQRKKLPPQIIDSVKRGQNILLDNYFVSHIARKIAPYDTRGTGLPVCIFRQLMLFDKLRESKFAQSESMINPITLIKIGSEGPDGLHPSHADLEAWREVFEAAAANKNFQIFCHPGVTVERNGAGSAIYDISGDIAQLIKEIYVGLQVPQVLMDGGADTTYVNGGVALDALKQRYTTFRNMLSNWLKRKIFAPISEIHGFYEKKDGVNHLIIPEIDWNHMSLFDTSDYIQTLVNLTQAGGQDQASRASVHSLYRSMGLDWDDEQRKIRKEAIQAAIIKKEMQALNNMSLNELRALEDDSEIMEDANNQPNINQNGNAGMPDSSGLPPPDMNLPGISGPSTPPALPPV